MLTVAKTQASVPVPNNTSQRSGMMKSVRSKYHILGFVGRGQYGRVLCAIHKLTGEMVALKEIDPQRLSTAKFLRELRFLVTLHHENVVSWQGCDHFVEGRYLVMDYCEGGNLRHLLNLQEQLSIEASIQLMIEILSGLAHAHGHGIIHCDLKPENILLHLVPNGWCARLSDFGISCMSHESSGKHDSMHGSPAYMAPERFYGEMTTASDVYAVGVVWFELLTGARPFSGAPADLIQAHRQQVVQFPDMLPIAIQRILGKALEKNPQQRFANAKEMLMAIQQLMKFPAAKKLPAAEPSLPELSSPEPSSPTLPHVVASPSKLQPPRSPRPGAMLTQFRTPTNAGATECLVLPSNVSRISSRELPISGSIRRISVRPAGCFLQTQQGLYLWAAGVLTREQVINTPTLVSIEEQGKWMASLTSNRSLEYQLEVRRLQPQTSARRSQLTLLTRPQHLLFLDQRYLLLITQSSQGMPEAAAYWMIYNRHGRLVYEFSVPFEVTQIVKCTNTHRLLAIEQGAPQCLMTIDLKPFQIRRIPLRLEAKRIASADWGYVVADDQGAIELLDQWGSPLGPMPISIGMVPSAMAMASETKLLMVARRLRWEASHQLLEMDLRSYLQGGEL